jgi:hypothetical protein
MRFPIQVSRQKKCPVCKRPGTRRRLTPRPEAAEIAFVVYSHVHGRSYPVFLGAQVMLGWDSGVAKHPRARASLGASFVVATRRGKDQDVGEMSIQFCSTRCLRRFFKEAIDELDRRIAAVKPEVRAARRGRAVPGPS